MNGGTYNLETKMVLVAQAQKLALDCLATMTPDDQARFAVRLAGLCAIIWPVGHEAELLEVIAQETRRRVATFDVAGEK